MNDERYPNWAGQAISTTDLNHVEKNLEFLSLPMAQEHLMKKYFDLDRLKRILTTSKSGITILPVGNRKYKRKKRVFDKE